MEMPLEVLVVSKVTKLEEVVPALVRVVVFSKEPQYRVCILPSI
jgi:hypothetical protein